MRKEIMMQSKENFIPPRGQSTGQSTERYPHFELLLKTGKSKSLFQNIKAWVRSELFNPYVMGGNCCARELYRLSGPHPMASQSIDDFVTSRDVESCDILIVSGILNPMMKSLIEEIYSKMATPRFVMAVGTCTASGAIFETIALDKIIPVDVYVAGCPPTMNSLIKGIELLRERMRNNISRELLEKGIK